MDIRVNTLAILDQNGEIVGTGFLVTKDLVLTCAHVLSVAGAVQGEAVQVRFTGYKEILSALVEPDYWGEDEDVALLRLERLPASITPLRLGLAEHSRPGSEFRSFGYATAADVRGIFANGNVDGHLQQPALIQLQSPQANEGMSGAPVFDDKRGVVIGIITKGHKELGPNENTTFATPSETVFKICKETAPDETPPYVGLDTFTNETAEFFFGRETLTQKLLNVLQSGCRFLAIFGPSGSGKSSVIRAGLLPKLQKGQVPGSQKWAQITMPRADNPLEQIREAGLDQIDVQRFLQTNPKYERVLLFIDQFEELFTLCPEGIRERFIQVLVSALENSPLTLILSMRDDFYSAFNAKATLLADMDYKTIVNVPVTIEPAELQAMIKSPADKKGLVLEEGLTQLMLKDLTRDAEARSSSLPLLEFTLYQLWERRRDGMLKHDAYREIKGVTGSLALWAGTAYQKLSKEDQSLAKALLISLVHVGDDPQGLPDTRRRRPLEECDEPTRRVIKHFADRRLLVTGEDKVELIHDTLLREWGLLNDWLKANRSFLAWRQKLAERYEEWLAGRAELLRGRELEIAKEYLEQRPQDLLKLDEYIIKSELQVKELEKQAQERERQAQRTRRIFQRIIAVILVLLGASGVFAWDQRNNALTSQLTSTAGIAFQVNALDTQESALQTSQANSTRAAAANTQAAVESTRAANVQATSTVIQGQVNEEAIQKLSENLSARALSSIRTNYTQALLLGAESFRLLESKHLDKGRYPDVVPALLKNLPVELVQTLPLPPAETVRKVLYSPDGNLLVTLGDSIKLWDTRTPGSVQPIRSWSSVSTSPPSDVAFSRDSTMLFVGYEDGTVGRWDIGADGLQKAEPLQAFPAGARTVVKVAVSTDGKMLAVAGQATIKLFDISDPNAAHEIGYVSHPHEGQEITYLWFDPNSKDPYLVSGGEDDTFRVWNLTVSLTPSAYQRTIVRNLGIADLAISAKYVLVAGSQMLDIYDNFSHGFIQIHSLDYLQVHNSPISSMLIDRESLHLYTAHQDGSILVWDISDPRNPFVSQEYSGHTNLVGCMALHPSGKFITSAGYDSRTIIWNISREVLPAIRQTQIQTGEGRVITDVAYSPGLNLLAIGVERSSEFYQGLVELWDVSDPSNISPRSEERNRSRIERVAFSPDDKNLFYLGGFIYTFRPPGYMLNLTRGSVRHIFELNTTEIFAAGNSYILAGEIGDGTKKIFRWDISKPDITRENRPVGQDACPFVDSEFARNGDLAAIATCKLQIWDFSDGKPPTLIKELDLALPNGVAFSPDGTLLASANANNSISIWERLPNGEFNLLITQNNVHPYGVRSVAFSTDGKMLASGGSDGAIKLWDISNPRDPSERVTLGAHSNTVLNGGIFFSGDGKTLISASKDMVILWDIDPQSWITKACELAGRNLTEPEWQEFIGSSALYHVTCPDLPSAEN